MDLSLEFFVERVTQSHEEVFICGSTTDLGDWDLRRAYLCHKVNINDNYWSCRLNFSNVKLGDTIGRKPNFETIQNFRS